MESFNDYLVEKDFTRIKRGDFLIRNHGNLEIEVKCKQFYPKKSPKVFYLNVDDFIGHFNMQTYTKTPIVLAIFQRLEDGSIIKEPNFVLINTINEDIKKLKIDTKNNVDCYKIPISYLKKDYKYIKQLTW